MTVAADYEPLLPVLGPTALHMLQYSTVLFEFKIIKIDRACFLLTVQHGTQMVAHLIYSTLQAASSN